MDTIHIYTDGGCRTKKIGEYENIGGWAYHMTYKEHVSKRSGTETNTTNNKMELEAILNSLSSLKRYDLETIVYSDSAYSIGCCTQWMNGWKRNGWKTAKKEPVKNKELLEELDVVMRKFSNLKFEKVKGHSGNEGNEIVDKLLNEAMDELTQKIEGKE